MVNSVNSAFREAWNRHPFDTEKRSYQQISKQLWVNVPHFAAFISELESDRLRAIAEWINKSYVMRFFSLDVRIYLDYLTVSDFVAVVERLSKLDRPFTESNLLDILHTL